MPFLLIRSLPHNQQLTESESLYEMQEQLGGLSGSPVKLEPNFWPSEVLKNIFVPMETIKSSMFLKAVCMEKQQSSTVLFVFHAPIYLFK